MSRRVPMLLGLAAAVLPLAVSGDPSHSPAPVFGPGRVVVVPVNLAVRAAAEVEPGLEPVWRELLQYFASEHVGVVALERASSGRLWNEVLADVGAEGTARDFHAAYARFAQRVAEQTEFDSIVFPTLVTRKARVHGRVATWDGAREPVEVPGEMSESIDTLREGKIVLTRSGASGEIAAASLHVAVLSPSGELRFERLGGLVVLQELVAPRNERDLELSVVPRPDAFVRAPLRDRIAATFAP